MFRLASTLIFKTENKTTNHNKGTKIVMFWAKPSRSLFHLFLKVKKKTTTTIFKVNVVTTKNINLIFSVLKNFESQ